MGLMAVVYAHKTDSGLVHIGGRTRRAGFLVTEAWPLDTETKGGWSLAKRPPSLPVFSLSAASERKRIGSYESEVQPELEAIVRERVETLWDQGISGADLVIACVGAGLRAFTRFARVEYANGEEVPAERFLTEVETVVLDSILGRLSKESAATGVNEPRGGRSGHAVLHPLALHLPGRGTGRGRGDHLRQRHARRTRRAERGLQRCELSSKRRRVSIGFATTRNVAMMIGSDCRTKAVSLLH